MARSCDLIAKQSTRIPGTPTACPRSNCTGRAPQDYAIRQTKRVREPDKLSVSPGRGLCLVSAPFRFFRDVFRLSLTGPFTAWRQRQSSVHPLTTRPPPVDESFGACSLRQSLGGQQCGAVRFGTTVPIQVTGASLTGPTLASFSIVQTPALAASFSKDRQVRSHGHLPPHRGVCG